MQVSSSKQNRIPSILAKEKKRVCLPRSPSLSAFLPSLSLSLSLTHSLTHTHSFSAFFHSVVTQREERSWSLTHTYTHTQHTHRALKPNPRYRPACLSWFFFTSLALNSPSPRPLSPLSLVLTLPLCVCQIEGIGERKGSFYYISFSHSLPVFLCDLRIRAHLQKSIKCTFLACLFIKYFKCAMYSMLPPKREKVCRFCLNNYMSRRSASQSVLVEFLEMICSYFSYLAD